MKCPKCGSISLLRRYASFWATVDEDGDDTASNFNDHKSSTEMTDDAMCSDCHHEFEWEDEDTTSLTINQMLVDDGTGRNPNGCKDSGTCHHNCTEGCFREKYCVPLSGSGFDDNWQKIEE